MLSVLSYFQQFREEKFSQCCLYPVSKPMLEVRPPQWEPEVKITRGHELSSNATFWKKMAQPYGFKRNQSFGRFLICMLTETFTRQVGPIFLPYYWGGTWVSKVKQLPPQTVNKWPVLTLGSGTTGVRNRSGDQKTWDLNLASYKALEKPQEPVTIPLSAPYPTG